MQSFTVDEYKIPITGHANDPDLAQLYSLDKDVLRRSNKELPLFFDYSIVKHSEKPALVLFMFHGWSSERQSMISQTRSIIEEAHRSRQSFEKIWFVQINAPFSMRQDEVSQDILPETQRFWWIIDGYEFIEHTLEQNPTALIETEGIGLEFSTHYVLDIVYQVCAMAETRNVAFFGFSQGGGMAVSVAVEAMDKYNVEALFMCSGLATNAVNISNTLQSRIRHSRMVAAMASPSAKDVELAKKTKDFLALHTFHSHGTSDPTLLISIGDEVEYFFQHRMSLLRIEYLTFDGYHEINDEVRLHLVAFMRKLSFFVK
jgi:predicted esterase